MSLVVRLQLIIISINIIIVFIHTWKGLSNRARFLHLLLLCSSYWTSSNQAWHIDYGAVVSGSPLLTRKSHLHTVGGWVLRGFCDYSWLAPRLASLVIVVFAEWASKKLVFLPIIPLHSTMAKMSVNVLLLTILFLGTRGNRPLLCNRGRKVWTPNRKDAS